jgi:hypothetical protein
MRKTIYNRLSGIVLLAILFYGLSICSTAQGTMVLKGNLDNQNVSQSDLGIGTLEFSGTSHQYIIGLNKMNNVTVNNSKGLGIQGNTEVDGVLALTGGLVTLGSNNLLLGPSATVNGTPTATNMVVPTGSGLLQKQFPDGTGVSGSFTYPVGDSTGTAEYSPVTLNFTTGNFTTGCIAGVNLVNSAYSGLTGDYLSRYWNLSQSGITSFNCNAQFNYVPADINGTEANIYCIRVNPSLATYSAANTSSHYLTASGLTSLGTFTGGLRALQTGLTAFLQGPYNATNHNMNTTLTTLPLGDRSDKTKFPNNQPYNIAPWNYAGTESVGSLPANTVDWVLVELRHASTASAATSATVLGRRAAFLLKTGSIVDLDGTSLKFRNLPAFSDNLYVVVRHRNHMAVMAANAVTMDANQVYVYDYSTGSGKIYGGIAGCKQVDTSPVVWALLSGDANADNHIWSNDNNVYISQYYLSSRYLAADFNMDKNVWSNDNNLFVGNYYRSNLLP